MNVLGMLFAVDLQHIARPAVSSITILVTAHLPHSKVRNLLLNPGESWWRLGNIVGSVAGRDSGHELRIVLTGRYRLVGIATV